MIITTIEWHKPTEKLPEETGNYLVRYARSNGFTEVHYSSKHKLFNALDSDTEEAARNTTFPVSYWANKPEFPEDESEGV
jgi:hypothetical protein